MSANQPNTAGGETKVVFTGAQPNPVLSFLQRPRIMLLLLAAWSLLGVLTQILTSNSIFFDNKDREIDGALAGFALGWEGIPLAAVYIYCLRDPVKHHAVFWLALLHMASLAASQLYHLGTGDFSFESIVVPLAGSCGLAALVFVHIFSPKEVQPATTPQPSG
jgi:peptidoglycan/LPS O-acetylase OafA/YrhL